MYNLVHRRGKHLVSSNVHVKTNVLIQASLYILFCSVLFQIETKTSKWTKLYENSHPLINLTRTITILGSSKLNVKIILHCLQSIAIWCKVNTATAFLFSNEACRHYMNWMNIRLNHFHCIIMKLVTSMNQLAQFNVVNSRTLCVLPSGF